MIDDSILGNTLGQLGGVIKQTGQQVVKTAKDIVEGVGEQVGVKTESSPQNDKISREIPKVTTGEVVDGFYSKSTDNSKNAVVASSTVDSEPKKQIVDKSEEEQKKLEIRQKLLEERHTETYYDPTFNPVKRQEELPAEKVVEEEEEKKRKQMEELQLQKKKKEEITSPFIKQGTHEKVPGISG